MNALNKTRIYNLLFHLKAYLTWYFLLLFIVNKKKMIEGICGKKNVLTTWTIVIKS